MGWTTAASHAHTRAHTHTGMHENGGVGEILPLGGASCSGSRELHAEPGRPPGPGGGA